MVSIGNAYGKFRRAVRRRRVVADPSLYYWRGGWWPKADVIEFHRRANEVRVEDMTS